MLVFGRNVHLDTSSLSFFATMASRLALRALASANNWWNFSGSGDLCLPPPPPSDCVEEAVTVIVSVRPSSLRWEILGWKVHSFMSASCLRLLRISAIICTYSGL